MASETRNCPSAGQLLKFSVGQLCSTDFDEVATHVEECQHCNSVLAEREKQSDDQLISELRSLNISECEFNEFQGQTTLSYPGLKLAMGAADSKEVTFDAGNRLAARLRQGACRLGRFELQSELGVGAFGHVFKALDTELNRTVAIKVQRAGAFAGDEEVERFLREAQSVAQLKHPGIVAIYDTVRNDDNVCYLVTEFVDGNSLDVASKESDFSFTDAAQIIAEIADALAYAHEHGIVHRDVKPSNVLLDSKQHPHVMDFGLAKWDIDTDNGVTTEGRVMGTPAYMSPEQARGDSQRVNNRSDIFSLGVMLYELIVGERPFQGNRRMLLLQVIEDDPRPPRHVRPDLPRDLETICLKAMSKSRSSRYLTAYELSADLRRFVRGEPIKARPATIAQRFWKWCRSYPVAASLLMSVPLISIAGFTYLSWLSTHFVQRTALESTRMEADMLEDINEFYSENVVAHVDPDRIQVTHQYATTPHSIPLPFTFMIDAGKRITEHKSGMQVKIYSDYPWRKEGGPQDEFERNALKTLADRFRQRAGKHSASHESGNANSELRSYHEFTQMDNRPVLRYARAQVMQQSCLGCHNDSANSPKRDWGIGDVVGVLAITRPLENDINSTQSGLRSAFNLIGVVALMLIGISVALLWTARQRSSIHPGVIDS